MSALDKLLLAAQGTDTAPTEDPPGDLVLAARLALAELRAALADSGEDDQDDGDKETGGHSGHPTFKALRKKGMDPAKASRLCAQADKKAKTTALADAAAVALGGLDVPEHDWVEATSAPQDLRRALRLTGADAGVYADPGYLGRCRFLVDTAEHARLSLSYVCQPDRMARYNPDQRGRVTARVVQAARGFSVPVPRDSAESAAVSVLLSLSALTAGDRRKPSAHTLGDSEDYPIPDEAHLSVAVARYKQGKYAGHKPEEIRAHILSRARALGKTVDLSTGTGLEEAAEAVVLLAAKTGGWGDGGVAMHHGPFNGTHSHSHFQAGAHDHPHQHHGDNSHDAGPTHNIPSGPWKPGGGNRR